MKILIRKSKRQFVEELDREVQVVKESKYVIADTLKDFSCKEGKIKKAYLNKKGIVKTDQNKEFHIFDGSYIDHYLRIKRMAQIIPLKDIGYIISYTGIGANSVVVEAGAGSGAVGCFLSRFVKKVVAYDINDAHIEVVKHNIKELSIKNYIVKKRNLYEGLDVKNPDLLLLDLPDPKKSIKACLQVKVGGFIVNYSPMINQTIEFSRATQNEKDLFYLKTVQVQDVEWEIDKTKARPRSKSNIHSGFLTFVRRI